MSAKNPKAGRGPCPNCAETVLFRVSPTSGRLTYSCDHCDHSAYADPGGKAHAKWTAALDESGDAPKAPPIEAPPEIAPKKVLPRTSIFDVRS